MIKTVKKIRTSKLCLVLTLIITVTCGLYGQHKYRLPAEWEPQESVWLQWPHNKTYFNYLKVNLVESTWIEMVKALVPHQKVNIICIDAASETRVKELLKNINNDKISYHVTKINDVWTRDNGPIYVLNDNDENVILDWTFNGWGGKVPKNYYQDDDKVPSVIGNSLGTPVVKMPMVLEGGSVEVNGKGTLMATKSSVINENRNPDMTQKQIEELFVTNFGVSNFLWLEGAEYEDPDIGGDITDGHVDGLARFMDDTTVLYSWCVEDETDPWFTRIIKKNREILENSVSESGKKWRMVPILETANPVGEYPAPYLNFLITNKVILFPIFGDPNDDAAVKTVQDLFPNRTVAPINCVELYKCGGGMIHCVTMQEPMSESSPVVYKTIKEKSIRNIDVKTTAAGIISFRCMIADTYKITLYSSKGEILLELENRYFKKGRHRIRPGKRVFASGAYMLQIKGTREETIRRVNVRY